MTTVKLSRNFHHLNNPNHLNLITLLLVVATFYLATLICMLSLSLLAFFPRDQGPGTGEKATDPADDDDEEEEGPGPMEIFRTFVSLPSSLIFLWTLQCIWWLSILNQCYFWYI